MEITPQRILEFTEYARQNPNATEQDYIANHLCSIPYLLCEGDPRRAPNWSRYLMEKLNRNRDTQYTLSTFMGFILNGKKPRMSDRRDIRLRNSKSNH